MGFLVLFLLDHANPKKPVSSITVLRIARMMLKAKRIIIETIDMIDSITPTVPSMFLLSDFLESITDITPNAMPAIAIIVGMKLNMGL